MSKRKVKIRYIAYFAVLIVFGGLLIASVVRRLMTDDAQMAGLVQSETMYVLVALAAVLPVPYSVPD